MKTWLGFATNRDKDMFVLLSFSHSLPSYMMQQSQIGFFGDASVTLPLFQQGKQNKLISMFNCIWWLSFWNMESN